MTITSIFGSDSQLLFTTAQQARVLADDASATAGTSGEAAQALAELIGRQLLELDPGQFANWVGLVNDPNLMFDSMNPDVRAMFTLVKEDVCSSAASENGESFQLVAIPVVTVGERPVWDLDLPDDISARMTEIFRKHGLVAPDATMEVLTRALSPEAARVLSDGEVFGLTRSLANNDMALTYSVLEGAFTDSGMGQSLVLEQGDRTVSAGILVAMVRGTAESLFPRDVALWQLEQQLENALESQVQMFEAQLEAMGAEASLARATAAAEMASLLSATEVVLAHDPLDWYDGVAEVMRQCRSLEARAHLTNSALKHSKGDFTGLQVGARLELLSSAPGVAVMLYEADGVTPAGHLVWESIKGETLEEGVEHLTDFLELMGVTKVAASAARVDR